MGCNGIDVSNNNGKLDLVYGFTGLDFVIAKASEGTSFTDGTFGYYAEEAKAAGALFGAYHFGHPELGAGAAEAELFIGVARPQSARSLWYDYEPDSEGNWPGPSAVADAAEIAAFAGHIKAHYPHARVGLYSTVEGFGRVLDHVRPDALWLCDLNNALETPGGPMPHGSAWNIHQYETFAGVDRDYSRWDKDQMRVFFGNWPAA